MESSSQQAGQQLPAWDRVMDVGYTKPSPRPDDVECARMAQKFKYSVVKMYLIHQHRHEVWGTVAPAKAITITKEDGDTTTMDTITPPLPVVDPRAPPVVDP